MHEVGNGNVLGHLEIIPRLRAANMPEETHETRQMDNKVTVVMAELVDGIAVLQNGWCRIEEYRPAGHAWGVLPRETLEHAF
jgi:hypothetical protein